MCKFCDVNAFAKVVIIRSESEHERSQLIQPVAHFNEALRP
jgi:hypothetical protein